MPFLKGRGSLHSVILESTTARPKATELVLHRPPMSLHCYANPLFPRAGRFITWFVDSSFCTFIKDVGLKYPKSIQTCRLLG